MNGKDIFVGLQYIDRRYIVEAAEAVLSGKKKMNVKRGLLIAAVIALMLLLVGCAVVYVLRLQDMAFGNRVQEYYDGTTQERTLLSLQGIKGTPGYEATKEWYEWLESYDTDGAVRYSAEAYSEDFGDDYYAYNLYSREMKNKLDEICEKYNLELLGKMYVDPNVEAACEALQISNIFRTGIQVESDFDYICYYGNGSFNLEGLVTLEGMDSHIISFRCHRKNAFTELYNDVGPEGSYQEWNYTTSYGMDVLIFIDEAPIARNASIIVENGEYLFLLSIHEFDEMPLPDQGGLEAYAEAFDFTVRPQRVSQEEMELSEERLEEENQHIAAQLEKRMHSFSSLGYEDRIKFQLENAVNPELLSFAVMDLEGNGTEDLLVGENGYIRGVYTTVDGGTQHMMPFDLVYLNTLNPGTSIGIGEYSTTYYIYLCEENKLAYVYDLIGDGVAYHFACVENGRLVWKERIVYDPVNHADAPWQMHDDTHNTYPISEDEFNRIVDSYKRFPIEMYPISAYPLEDDQPSGIGRSPDVYMDYAELVRRRTELDKDDSYINYLLRDLDGDGQMELIWREGSWIGTFTIRDGQVKQLVSGPEVALCEDNILSAVRSFVDGNKTYCYYKIENGNAVLVDYLRYDRDRNGENPWFCSPDLTGQDMTLEPISERKAMSIIDSYKRVEMDMKPVSHFPTE